MQAGLCLVLFSGNSWFVKNTFLNVFYTNQLLVVIKCVSSAKDHSKCFKRNHCSF